MLSTVIAVFKRLIDEQDDEALDAFAGEVAYSPDDSNTILSIYLSDDDKITIDVEAKTPVAAPAQQAVTWQRIETAPKDGLGAGVIVAVDGSVGEAHYVDRGWYWIGNDPTDSWGGQIYPTHWQPLPQPPTPKAAQEAKS